MRIALGQINTTVGDFPGNEAKILGVYRRAVEDGADLVVLPELSTTGYPPRDLLLRPDFVAANEAILERVAAVTGRAGLLVGYVGRR
ncbi:MAG: nitrilase-related carbon-nitrogen hydrolase, partial [Limisphaerales bacterium]